MHIALLGTAAGGGLPQWNCGCPNCLSARAASPAVTPRHQSSLAVSADGVRWVLVNASPDVRLQLAATPALHPRGLRDSPVSAVVLSNADIDHALGLFVLREGGAPPIYATPRVKRALVDGLRIVPVLSAYGPVALRTLHTDAPCALHDRAGLDLGLRVSAFTVASKPPPYMLPLLQPHERADLYAGDTVGLVFSTEADPETRAVYVPGVKTLDARLAAHFQGARLILVDGTCFTDDELVRLGCSAKTALEMGHAPLSGPGGMAEFLAQFGEAERVLVHINNTNPILDASSEARRWLEARQLSVGYDGQRWVL
ncbi:MAG: pyrroloquinoline quinone biosynthesis protein PqqB [Myxococcales bacterium]|nr:pyrroloquinoline quinone biosynthesis protein PqqB [Myxococcales bacterium]